MILEWVNFPSLSTTGRVISFSNLKGYIYIYIVIQKQTVTLYHNSSVWLGHVGRLDRNLPNFTLDLVSYRSAIKRTTSAQKL